MEIIAVVDGSVQNAETFEVAKAAAAQCRRPGREIIVLPKWQRGGRVSTLNAGLARASGELVMNADADTSFDNDMVSQIVPLFADPMCRQSVALCGCAMSMIRCGPGCRRLNI